MPVVRNAADTDDGIAAGIAVADTAAVGNGEDAVAVGSTAAVHVAEDTAVADMDPDIAEVIREKAAPLAFVVLPEPFAAPVPNKDHIVVPDMTPDMAPDMIPDMVPVPVVQCLRPVFRIDCRSLHLLRCCRIVNKTSNYPLP